MSTDNCKVSFIGAGNMASAIIMSMINNSADPKNIYVFDIDKTKLTRYENLGVKTCVDVASLVINSDFLFICVKPQQFSEVLNEIKNIVRPNTVIITIAAGITTDYIRGIICKNSKIIRVMPNTPLLIGKGATAISYDSPVTEKEFEFVRDIFAASGSVCLIKEKHMNDMIALNGSTPAFLYLYAKYFIDYAVMNGIDYNIAKELFAQTMIGSAEMILKSGSSIEELIDMVSSKGGTTLKGLEMLNEYNLKNTVYKAADASVQRARELEK